MRTSTLLSALLLTACSSSNSAGPDASSGDDATADAPKEAAKDAPADTAGDDASEGGCGEAGAALTANTLVLTSSNLPNGGADTTNLLFKNYITSPGSRCSVVKQALGDAGDGTCFIQDCRPGDGGTAPQGVNAGAITLEQATNVLLTTSPNQGDNHYPPGTTTTPWAAGDMLHFVAAGGCDMAAFDVPLTAPPTVVVTSPAAGDGGPIAISQASDYTVTWTPPASGGVTVEFEQGTSMSDPAGSDLRVLCEVSGASGTATIPASILGMFPTGSATPTLFVIGGNTTADVMPGGYSMHVALQNWTSFQAVFQ